MAKFHRNKADKFVGGGDLAGWFSLKDDRDSALVRFLYKSIDDLMGYSTHEIRVDGKVRQVNCIREYSDPVDACPMCNDAVPLRAKFFIMLQNVDTNEVQIWERGTQFIPILEDAFEDLKGDITQHIFKITRRGKARSTSTTYTVKRVSTQGKATYERVIAKYPLPKIMGGLVLDKSYEDMEYFQDYGEFPENDFQEETPHRRNAGATRRPTRGNKNVSRRKAAPIEDDFDDHDEDDYEDDDFGDDDFQDDGIKSDPLPKEFDTDEDDLDDFDGGLDDFEDDDFQDEDDFEDDEDDFEEETPKQRPARGTRGTKPARGARGTRPSRGTGRNDNF